MCIVGRTLDHADKGREPPGESVTVVVTVGEGRPVAPPPPCCCCCCCCCCCFCEGSRVERGNRELPRDIMLLLGGLGG